MQPKCISKIHITAERFKEICLNDDNKENSKLLDELLKDFFDPEVKLNLTFNDSSQIINYISGGLDFEDFKTKSNSNCI